VAAHVKEKRKILLLGHSTGGILVLSFILEQSFVPELLVLAAVPKKIDSGYPARWQAHSRGKNQLPFCDLAGMVSLINTIGKQKFIMNFPCLLLHGSADKLVPVREVEAWKTAFSGPVRTVIIPGMDHRVFQSSDTDFATDCVVQAATDMNMPSPDLDDTAFDRLKKVEQDTEKFLAASPFSKPHLVQCPAGRRLTDVDFIPGPDACTKPVFANIEITTRCHAGCTFCARTRFNRPAEDMPADLFSRILDLLPHAYRITMVGLGEPLLHPRVTDFIAMAVAQGRRISLVTNGMNLTRSLSAELIKSGLSGITFSLDSIDQEIVSQLRSGTEVNRIISSIRCFKEIASGLGNVSVAIFCALSVKTVPHLKRFMETVSGLGVDAVMLTDLNFAHNHSHSLWRNADETSISAVNEAVLAAFSRQLPVLSIHGLEVFGLDFRYRDFLLTTPFQLFERRKIHKNCLSPWQTIPVGVRGMVTVCDCQPEHTAGDLLSQPFSEIWCGKVMSDQRKRMLSTNPPSECRCCPRF
jgi:MoaA/NifB/PqqE/SkfB family radical SAM enzyme/dienelactone hydrolase